MDNYIGVLKNTPLFKTIEEKEIAPLLKCLGAFELVVPKNGFALMAGELPDHIGIVIEGHLQISRDDAEGVKSLLANLLPGDIYAEALACAEIKRSPVNVVAIENSKVIKLCFNKVLTVCTNSCVFHTKLVANMVGVIARKNIMLQSRMELLDKKTIRGRLLYYLYQQKSMYGTKFTIPFNRNELAEYLAVDRSALSREIGKLKDEGILVYHKNKFEVFS